MSPQHIPDMSTAVDRLRREVGSNSGLGEKTFATDILSVCKRVDDLQVRVDYLRVTNADLLGALKGAQFALLCSILFIEGAFPEPRSRIMADELVSYRTRELKARVAIARADGEA